MAAKLVLASASPRRRALLEQLGVSSFAVEAPHIDETPNKNELPRLHAMRLAREKALDVASRHPYAFVLAADTVVASGARILPQANDAATAKRCLTQLSGKRHRVHTAIALLTPTGKLLEREVRSIVQFKRLSGQEVESYLASKEWEGKAGGYAIQGKASSFIPWINGSYTAIVGLPLYETQCLLEGAGFYGQ